eukprot:jgi/Psemu1/59692/gm1.59692_g
MGLLIYLKYNEQAYAPSDKTLNLTNDQYQQNDRYSKTDTALIQQQQQKYRYEEIPTSEKTGEDLYHDIAIRFGTFNTKGNAHKHEALNDSFYHALEDTAGLFLTDDADSEGPKTLAPDPILNDQQLQFNFATTTYSSTLLLIDVSCFSVT